MKEWKKPELIGLNVQETEQGGTTHTTIDQLAWTDDGAAIAYFSST